MTRPVEAFPRIALQIGGVDLPASTLPSISALRVSALLQLPAQCELVFVDPPPLVEKTCVPGATIDLRPPLGRSAWFMGEVTVVEHLFGPGRGQTLRVRAYDRLHRLRKRATPRAWPDASADGVARELAMDIGVEYSVSGSGPTWGWLPPTRTDDLDFLTEVCERSSLVFCVREGRLHVMTTSGEGQPIPLAFGTDLLEASVTRSGEQALRHVSAVAWASSAAVQVAGTASSARTGRTAGGAVEPSEIGCDGSLALLDVDAQRPEQAEALAQARLDHAGVAEVVFRGVAVGSPGLAPGARVDVSGLGPTLSGEYVLTGVVHRLDPELGMVSELTTAPPPRRVQSSGSAITGGVVTDVGDPDGLGRVRVALPAWGGVESDWLPVCFPGAGTDKGLVLLPNVQDRVLVALGHDSPSSGVVLGGVFGDARMTDPGVSTGIVTRFAWRTPAGQSILFDDVEGTTRITSKDGSWIELGPSATTVHSVHPLTLEAPGQAVVLRGASIDFQRA